MPGAVMQSRFGAPGRPSPSKGGLAEIPAFGTIPRGRHAFGNSFRQDLMIKWPAQCKKIQRSTSGSSLVATPYTRQARSRARQTTSSQRHPSCFFLESSDTKRKRSRSISPVSSRVVLKPRDVTECPIPPPFKKKANKIFVRMRTRLSAIISQATSDVEKDDIQTKLLATSIGHIAEKLIIESEEGNLSVRTFRTAADELGSLLDYKPKVRIAEKIRELLIAIVKPARILECVEYDSQDVAFQGLPPNRLQDLTTIYHYNHSLHVCQIISRFFGEPEPQVAALCGPDLWFAGKTSTLSAESILSRRIDGSFLIRDSESKPGSQSVSIRANNRIYHYRINKLDDGKYALKNEYRFNSVEELVAYHVRPMDVGGVVVSMKMGFRDLHSFPWYHGVMPQSMAVALLDNAKDGSFLVRVDEGDPSQRLMVNVKASDTITQYPILVHPKGGYQLENGPCFDNVEKLVTFYSQESNSGRTALRRALTRRGPIRKQHDDSKAQRKYVYRNLAGAKAEGIKAPAAVAQSVGSGFGQMGYYQRHWLKKQQSTPAASELEPAIPAFGSQFSATPAPATSRWG